MAGNTKFTKDAVFNQLKHIERKLIYPKNRDIDPERTHLNYSLTPKRKMDPFQYFKNRLSELRVMKGDTVNYMSGWIVTKPKDLEESYEKKFFESCYAFLEDRYGGEKNVVAANVHKDESGEAHLHFLFIPVVENTPNETMIKVVRYLKEHPDENNTVVGKALGLDRKTVRRYRNCTEKDIKYERLSARGVINKKDLVTFHRDLQKYLDEKGIPANVYTGITKKQGGNMTVEELKRQRDYLVAHGGNVKEIVKTINRIVQEIEGVSHEV